MLTIIDRERTVGADGGHFHRVCDPRAIIWRTATDSCGQPFLNRHETVAPEMDNFDPTTVGSLDELAACLKRVHIHAGKPTLRSLELKTKYAKEFLPGTRLKQVTLTHSTLSDVLRGQKFPGKAFLLTFVDACGIDIEDDRRWEQAWDRLAQNLDGTGQTGMEELRQQLAEARAETGQLRQQLADAGELADQTIRASQKQAERLRQQVAEAEARADQGARAAQAETEGLRQQLADAETRADQAVREADELRRQFTDAPKPKGARTAEIPFWDVLDPTEREMLRAVASMRQFAGGATIMQQGGPADYVLVILAGRVSIRVSENGKERVLAERGPGQLVGERGALQVSVRSANVIALEMIWALVVETKDFAAFLTANPRILTFVQEQRHDRGTADPDGHDDGGSAGFPGAHASGMSDSAPAGHRRSLKGENCTVILTDVVAFGSPMRNDEDRLLIRKALFRIIHEAVHDMPDVQSEDRGDGVLIVIPPNIPTARAIDQLLHVLPRALEDHNNSQVNSAQIQLRLSVDVGPVVSDTMGSSGEAIIVAARLVEAPAFKEAFIGSAAHLGIIVSRFVYDTVVRHNRNQDYVASYSEVPVEVKQLHTTAWMKLIG